MSAVRAFEQCVGAISADSLSRTRSCMPPPDASESPFPRHPGSPMRITPGGFTPPSTGPRPARADRELPPTAASKLPKRCAPLQYSLALLRSRVRLREAAPRSRSTERERNEKRCGGGLSCDSLVIPSSLLLGLRSRQRPGALTVLLSPAQVVGNCKGAEESASGSVDACPHSALHCSPEQHRLAERLFLAAGCALP